MVPRSPTPELQLIEETEGDEDLSNPLEEQLDEMQEMEEVVDDTIN